MSPTIPLACLTYALGLSLSANAAPPQTKATSQAASASSSDTPASDRKSPTAPTRAAAAAVAASSNYIVPGQLLTLRWYFTGQKVVVAGGRFKQGQIVTGKTLLTDRPLKTTRYTFDVWYHAAPVATSAPASKPSAATKLIHVQYPVTVEVLKGMESYVHPRGWQIAYLNGWRHDDVSGGNGAGVVYFQKEMDSVERLAVAILPDRYDTCEHVMEKVQSDIPSSYTKVETVVQKNLTYADMPAQMTIFTGNDETHPGTRTQSIVMTMVREGRAYIVSARTSAANFAARRALLEHMVRSFAVTGAAAPGNKTDNVTFAK